MLRGDCLLKGNIVALITPFNDDGSVNYLRLRELVEFHYFNKVDALLLLGTTSESPTLLDFEKEEIVKCVINQNNKRLKIVVGISENKTEDAVINAIKYEKMGADYLLVLTPFYNRCNYEGLYLHYRLVANSVKIPIILYNIPARTGVNIDIDVIKKLKLIPNIIGIKEANKDISHILNMSYLCDENFKLYCGNDDLSYLFLALNAAGIINVISNFDPYLISSLISIYDENPSLAFNFFNKCYELLKCMFIETNPIPIKSLMNYNNMNVGGYRLPLCNMEKETFTKLINAYLKCRF